MICAAASQTSLHGSGGQGGHGGGHGGQGGGQGGQDGFGGQGGGSGQQPITMSKSVRLFCEHSYAIASSSSFSSSLMASFFLNKNAHRKRLWVYLYDNAVTNLTGRHMMEGRILSAT